MGGGAFWNISKRSLPITAFAQNEKPHRSAKTGARRAASALPILLGGVVAAASAFLYLRSRHRIEGWAEPLPASRYFDVQDSILRERFTDADIGAAERYRHLFNYILAGVLEFRTVAGERIYYPGVKGNRGHRIEGLEGFARTAPLLAAWIASGRDAVMPDPRGTGGCVDLRALLANGIAAGTDPDAPTYWGDIAADYDQRIVEAADVALALWLTRDHVWPILAPAQRLGVGAWLRQVTARVTPDNNWLLFVVTVLETLNALGLPADMAESRRRYAAFKRHYLESGWFYDTPKSVDFYNAWAISYALFWIDRINPAFDPDFIRPALAQSATLVLHLVSPDGIPIMGRSICYRMAVPAPVVMQAIADPRSVDPGLARRTLDVTWRYFVSRGALAQGRATQGYFGTDERILDRYSGPASSQWSLRSLVPAFLAPPDAPFWQAAERPLPVEQADYRLDLPALGWTVTGRNDTSEIVIRIRANAGQAHALRTHGAWRRAVERLFCKPHRPGNRNAKYGNAEYSSGKPFMNTPHR